jgi:hypothetical protein
MNRRGVGYDAGILFSGLGWRLSTRPVFDPGIVRRELEIIRTGLHCNAVRIAGTDIGRLMTTAEAALIRGLEVWLSPVLFERGQRQTISNLVRAASAAEPLRRRYPGRLVLSVGTESTLFTRGIIPGATIAKRLASPENRALGFGVVDNTSLGLHLLPVIGRFVRARLNGDYERDEALQAREITETLAILDEAGVDGAFVHTFAEPIMTYSKDPRYDLDRSGMALVKTYASGHGTTYPDMIWEPKPAFRAVAGYYARDSASATAGE